MGSVWSRLGSEVTVIEYMDRVCPAMDVELTKKFQATLKKQGFKFQMSTKVVSWAIPCTLPPSHPRLVVFIFYFLFSFSWICVAR